MDSFSIKRGDTGPAIRRSFVTDAGMLEIPEGSRVVFSMAEAITHHLVVNRQPCRIEGDGTVVYYWQDGDTDIAGLYEAEFDITRPDEAIETAPNSGFIIINITRDIA